MLAAVALGLAQAQGSEPITLTCTFYINFLNEYICRLERIEVLNETLEVVITGDHLTNRTDADVSAVLIRNSSTPFMIQQIFLTFPNILELDIQGSNLQSIIIPESVQLVGLVLSRNNISRIVNETFAGQSRLQFITAIDAGIQEIEEDAFLGLESLKSLVLIDNRISELTQQTLSPLVNVARLDFERNLLTQIGNIFTTNLNLTNLYLEYNQINEISPIFVQHIQNSLETINLRGNHCVDRYFTFNLEMELVIFNNLMTPCFNNFVGEIPKTRQITLEFQGPLSLFDAFGNIIARVN